MHFCQSGNQQEISMLTITIKKQGDFREQICIVISPGSQEESSYGKKGYSYERLHEECTGIRRCIQSFDLPRKKENKSRDATYSRYDSIICAVWER